MGGGHAAIAQNLSEDLKLGGAAGKIPEFGTVTTWSAWVLGRGEIFQLVAHLAAVSHRGERRGRLNDAVDVTDRAGGAGADLAVLPVLGGDGIAGPVVPFGNQQIAVAGIVEQIDDAVVALLGRLARLFSIAAATGGDLPAEPTGHDGGGAGQHQHRQPEAGGDQARVAHTGRPRSAPQQLQGSRRYLVALPLVASRI